VVNTDVSFRDSSVLQCCTLVGDSFVFNYTPNIHKLSKLDMVYNSYDVSVLSGIATAW
jgi:hypothetical protein